MGQSLLHIFVSAQKKWLSPTSFCSLYLGMLFSSEQRYKTENRQPALGGGQLSYREDIFVTSALAEITSNLLSQRRHRSVFVARLPCSVLLAATDARIRKCYYQLTIIPHRFEII
jgi:hypothetical protein